MSNLEKPVGGALLSGFEILNLKIKVCTFSDMWKVSAICKNVKVLKSRVFKSDDFCILVWRSEFF